MRVKTTGHATAEGRLPVEVHWKCSTCGKWNCTNEVVFFQGSSFEVSRNGNINSQRLENRARENAQLAGMVKISSILSGETDNLNLHSKCSKCGHVEPWAWQYKKIPIFSSLAYIIYSVVLLYYWYTHQETPGTIWLCILLFVAYMVLDYIFTTITSKRFEKKKKAALACLPYECRANVKLK